MTAEICGTTPEARGFRRKMSAYPASETTPLPRLVHDLADLVGVGLGEGAAEDGEVLGEDVDQAAINLAVAGHHPVARDELLLHPEVPGPVGDQHVGLDEA